MANKTLKFALYSIIFLNIVTFGYAFEVYGDNIFLTPNDEKYVGSFIIENFEENLTVKSNSRFISFDEFGEIKEKSAGGVYIVNDVIGMKYYVDIPKDTNIGVYRDVIEIKSNDDTKYINIKISVQNEFLIPFFEFFSQKYVYYSMISMLILFSAIVLFIVIRGIFK